MISNKQKMILAFPYSRFDALICDGAVRSGKTSLMTWAFIKWAMDTFDGQRFGICGKTVDSAAKNIVVPFISMSLAKERYTMRWRRADKVLEVTRGTVKNFFEVFGGKDESSFALIQGRTLAGVLLDEVVLMPESFVNQALARCSVAGAKLWFSCNPGSPNHWFYLEWIKKRKEHNVLYLHFEMTDNPSLPQKVRDRYETMYSGVFYERYVLGRWVLAEGIIYDMFDRQANTYTEAPPSLHFDGARTIACDYGTTNPSVFLDIYDYGGKIYVEREYRWDSRAEQKQKTDEEYVDDMVTFMGGKQCAIIVDPSAASFIAALHRRGFYVIQADNDVLNGIRRTSTLIQRRNLLINQSCTGLLGEMDAYVWDEKACMHGEDKPVKEQDHGPDALRYFVNSLADWRFE